MKKEAKLKLLEKEVTALGYRVRYEKGNFLGGECRVKENNIVVVNRFLPIEGKIYTIARVAASVCDPQALSRELRAIIEESGLSPEQLHQERLPEI